MFDSIVRNLDGIYKMVATYHSTINNIPLYMASIVQWDDDATVDTSAGLYRSFEVEDMMQWACNWMDNESVYNNVDTHIVTY